MRGVPAAVGAEVPSYARTWMLRDGPDCGFTYGSAG